MSINPYQPPSSSPATETDFAALRAIARQAVRRSLLILSVPAFYNYCAFDAQAIVGAGTPPGLALLYRAANLLGSVVGGALVWFLGLPLIELFSHGLRLLVARTADASVWNRTLYEALRRSPYLAVPGAVLWAVWVFGFYQLRIDIVTISWVVGVPAHLLAAALYFPLICRWCRLAACPSAPGAPQSKIADRSGGERQA